MVTAAGSPWTPAGLGDDEIVVSQWLADDLRVKPGDEIAVSYFLPESGANLTEATNLSHVHSIGTHGNAVGGSLVAHAGFSHSIES